MAVREVTVIDAIDLAIEGQKFLREKWRNQYGNSFDDEFRARRVSEITDLIAALKTLRSTQSCS